MAWAKVVIALFHAKRSDVSYAHSKYCTILRRTALSHSSWGINNECSSHLFGYWSIGLYIKKE
jgi:hypothetical protein